MVYKAKLVGLLMRLHLIATECCNQKSCVIGLDSRAAIKTLTIELTNPGHYIAAEALRIAKYLKTRNANSEYKLTIRWTAGHIGIKGNKKADKEAKHIAVSKHLTAKRFQNTSKRSSRKASQPSNKSIIRS